MDYCHCGIYIRKDKYGKDICPRHGVEWKVKPKARKKIGRYSGRSKRYKGAYEKE